MNYYFKIPGSPDLAPIENCWQGPKAYTQTVPQFNDKTTMELIKEGWSDKHLDQDFIDKQCLSMPQRLWNVIDSNDQMSGW